jgi:hypothetical protein
MKTCKGVKARDTLVLGPMDEIYISLEFSTVIFCILTHSHVLCFPGGTPKAAAVRPMPDLCILGHHDDTLRLLD